MRRARAGGEREEALIDVEALANFIADDADVLLDDQISSPLPFAQ